MDKTSCQRLSPRLHPEVGASSRRVALGTRGCGGPRSPGVRQVLAGQGHEGSLPGGRGGAQSGSAEARLGVGHLGRNYAFTRAVIISPRSLCVPST